MPIQVICAWCGEHMGEKEGEEDERYPVSHGICPDCRKKVLAESEETPKPKNQ